MCGFFTNGSKNRLSDMIFFFYIINESEQYVVIALYSFEAATAVFFLDPHPDSFRDLICHLVCFLPHSSCK